MLQAHGVPELVQDLREQHETLRCVNALIDSLDDGHWKYYRKVIRDTAAMRSTLQEVSAAVADSDGRVKGKRIRFPPRIYVPGEADTNHHIYTWGSGK